jgi:hypothetical protein
MFGITPKNWITPPNQLVNPSEGNSGHMKASHFALLVQARQSMIFNGGALLLIHTAMAGASKALKGRFVYPLSAASVGALTHATLYTAALDGRSWYACRDRRSFPKGFIPNKFFACLAMALLAPYIATKVSKHMIKNPVSLKVAYSGGCLSAGAIYHMERDK